MQRVAKNAITVRLHNKKACSPCWGVHADSEINGRLLLKMPLLCDLFIHLQQQFHSRNYLLATKKDDDINGYVDHSLQSCCSCVGEFICWSPNERPLFPMCHKQVPPLNASH